MNREKISAILILLINGVIGPEEATDKITELYDFSDKSDAIVCPECEGVETCIDSTHMKYCECGHKWR